MAEITVYCDLNDVQMWVKRVQFSENSKITPTDVDNYIQHVCRIIDGTLRKLGISLPVPESAVVSLGILRTLASLEAASWAEQNAFFAGNKNESEHGTWLHTKYVELLADIQNNPSILSDVVSGSIAYMGSSTTDYLPGGSKENKEVYTAEALEDFVAENKVYSPSEKIDSQDSSSGDVDVNRV